jgi:hypothetical protein
MDSPIRITHFDLLGDKGADIIQGMTGCDRSTALDFVNPNSGEQSNPFSPNYVSPPPRPHIRLERAEMAAEKGDMQTALSEFEYLYENHYQVCATHVRMYIRSDWTHYRDFSQKKDADKKAQTMKTLSTC